MRVISLIIIILISEVVMAQGIFIHSYNEQSKRYAILDEMEESAILYLSEVGSQKPSKDAFAYMRVEPIDLPTWKKRMSEGGPPILYIDIASKEKIISESKESDFDFVWSIDGESVALMYSQSPIVFIYKNEKYGFSKAVIKKSPIVSTWNQDLYEKLFVKK